MIGDTHGPNLESVPDLTAERITNPIERYGGFLLSVRETEPNETWFEVYVCRDFEPGKVNTHIRLDARPRPDILPQPEDMEDMKSIVSEAWFFTKVFEHDEHNILNGYGYEASRFKSGTIETYDLTTPTSEQIVKSIAGAMLSRKETLALEARYSDKIENIAYTAANVVLEEAHKSLEASARLPIIHGIALQTLVGTYLGQKADLRAIEDYRSQDEPKKSECSDDLKAACNIETVYWGLQTVTNSLGRIVRSSRRYQWSEWFTQLVDELTPVISGRHNVKILSDEEKDHIVLYLKHIAEFFKLESDKTVQSYDRSSAG